MAGEIRLGSNFQVFYHIETAANKGIVLYGNDNAETDEYIELGIVNNAKITFNKENLETKGLNYDYVTENQSGKKDVQVTLEGEWTSGATDNDWETFIDNFDATTEVSYSIILKELDDASADHYYWATGCVMGKVGISATIGEVIKVNVDLSGIFYNNNTDDPSISTNEARYAGGDGTTGFDDNLFSVQAGDLWTKSVLEKVAASGWTNTGDIDEATAWEIEMNYNVQTKWHMNGNDYPARTQRTGYNVTGKVTIDFENTDELEELLSDTGGTLQINLNHPTDTKYLNLVGVLYESIDLDVSEWEMVEMEVPFKARTLAFTGF